VAALALLVGSGSAAFAFEPEELDERSVF